MELMQLQRRVELLQNVQHTDVRMGVPFNFLTHTQLLSLCVSH